MSAEALAATFLAAGVRPGGVLLVHSSVSSLAPDAGAAPPSPSTVLEALLLALGPAGTLLVPAFSYLFVTPESPAFDARSTPTNLGALPTCALRHPAALRSVHPTHSVAAIGARAAELTSQHCLDRTPVGPRSPFALLAQAGGQVAFLGCGARCNTLVHGVEEAALPAPPPYLLLPGLVTYSVTDGEGRQESVQHARHDFGGVGQRYERLRELVPRGAYRASPLPSGRLLEVFEARALWDTAAAALAADPCALTQRLEPGADEGHYLARRAAKDGTHYYAYTVGPIAAAGGGGSAPPA